MALGLVGVVASAVMVGKATPKACKVAEENAQQLDTDRILLMSLA